MFELVRNLTEEEVKGKGQTKLSAPEVLEKKGERNEDGENIEQRGVGSATLGGFCSIFHNYFIPSGTEISLHFVSPGYATLCSNSALMIMMRHGAGGILYEIRSTEKRDHMPLTE